MKKLFVLSSALLLTSCDFKPAPGVEIITDYCELIELEKGNILEISGDFLLEYEINDNKRFMEHTSDEILRLEHNKEYYCVDNQIFIIENMGLIYQIHHNGDLKISSYESEE